MPRVVLSLSKSPLTPRLAQEVSARDDVMTDSTSVNMLLQDLDVQVC